MGNLEELGYALATVADNRGCKKNRELSFPNY